MPRDAARLYRQLLLEARPYWPRILLLAFVNLLATPIALLGPVPLKIAVDSIAGSVPLPGFYRAIVPDVLEMSVTGLVVFTGALMVVIAVLDELQSFAAWLLETYTGERLVLDFRAKLFRHIQRLSLSYHDTKGTADSMYRLQYDAPSIQNISVNGVMPFVSSILTLLAMIYVIMRIDWMLAVVAVAAVPLLYLTTRSSVGKLRESWKRVRELESSALSVLQEVLASIRVVKAFGREDDEQRRFEDRSQSRLGELMRVIVLQMKFDLTIAVLIAVTSAATLSLGILHVRDGTLSLGNLLLIVGYLAQLYAPLRTMSRKSSQMQSALAGAERALGVLDEVPDVAERPTARPLARAAGEIELRNVSFGYTADAPVLRDVSLRIPAGTSVGIAGPTGAGKTTLLSLMTRFYDPTAGEILLDGIDLRDIVLADLRNQFAIVHQDAVLFSTSVADNILYAKPGATGTRGRAGRPRRQRARFHRRAAAGLPDSGRRTRHAPLRRRAAAHRSGARVSEGRAGAAARRADELRGRQDRVGDHGGARSPDGGADDASHRPSPEHPGELRRTDYGRSRRGCLLYWAPLDPDELAADKMSSETVNPCHVHIPQPVETTKHTLGTLSGPARAYVHRRHSVRRRRVRVLRLPICSGIPVSPEWLILVALTVASGWATLRIPGMPISFSISDTFNIAAALLFGPSAGAITAALDGLVLTSRFSSDRRSMDRRPLQYGGALDRDLDCGAHLLRARGKPSAPRGAAGRAPVAGTAHAVRCRRLRTEQRHRRGRHQLRAARVRFSPSGASTWRACGLPISAGCSPRCC